MRSELRGGVRCSAGFGARTTAVRFCAVAHAAARSPRRRRASAVPEAATCAVPCGPPLHLNRGRGDTRHLVRHNRLTHRGPRAHHRRTRVHARDGSRTNSSPAPPSPDERCVTSQRAVSGAAPGSARSHPRSASADARPPVRPGGAPPNHGAVSRHIGGHPPPPHAAMSRARDRSVSAEHHRPAPPCPHPHPATTTASSRRRAAPAPTGTTRSPTRAVHHRGPHAHRRTRALMHAMVAEQIAHLRRAALSPPSGAATGSALPPTRLWTRRTLRTSRPPPPPPPRHSSPRTSAGPTDIRSTRPGMAGGADAARCRTPRPAGRTHAR
ncbi:hypothetical protein GobsT_37480 [Gemmata obscuriglobus]|nr:hypothetical protein GobsT_37480 [Gemmata obscuriglobus]VTS07493.1 unnamed protein product [Gemmata obscuriglobus UQM 2246]